MWLPQYRKQFHGRFAAFEYASQRIEGLHPVSMAQLLDEGTYLADDILAKVDHASMTHGLEVRTPLIDIRVMELAASIPPDISIGGLSGDGWNGKKVIKNILSKDFDPEFTHRKKMGFSVPIQRWLQPGGPETGRGTTIDGRRKSIVAAV